MSSAFVRAPNYVCPGFPCGPGCFKRGSPPGLSLPTGSAYANELSRGGAILLPLSGKGEDGAEALQAVGSSGVSEELRWEELGRAAPVFVECGHGLGTALQNRWVVFLCGSSRRGTLCWGTCAALLACFGPYVLTQRCRGAPVVLRFRRRLRRLPESSSPAVHAHERQVPIAEPRFRWP
jgi:hypothetical protein